MILKYYWNLLVIGDALSNVRILHTCTYFVYIVTEEYQTQFSKEKHKNIFNLIIISNIDIHIETGNWKFKSKFQFGIVCITNQVYKNLKWHYWDQFHFFVIILSFRYKTEN